MSKTNDGGYAFPVPGTERNYPEFGMSLRDWFAGQALAGLCANPNNHNIQEVCARIAYAQADAMLAERQKDGAE